MSYRTVRFTPRQARTPEVRMAEPTPNPVQSCSGKQLDELFQAAADWLETNVNAVNALNVFPVPDGDTGTNMLLTIRSGLRRTTEALAEDSTLPAAAVSTEFARGALMGARGNSGVILSQYLGGFADGLAGVEMATSTDMARALTSAADAAYGAMSNPVEGTILTVARSAGVAASIAAQRVDLSETLIAAAESAQEAVARTPDLLPVLAQAGVVDSGGQGLAILLRAAASALTGTSPGTPLEATEIVGIDQAWLAEQPQADWGYCTEFVVLEPRVSPDEMRVAMATFGESESIVSGEGLIRVHIHTALPEEALTHAETAGTLEQVSIRNMDQQHEQFLAGHTAGVDAPVCGVIAVAAGVGFVRILRSLGAGAIIWGGQSMNPSAEEIAEAADSIPADQVIVLPNNRNIVATARLANGISSKTLAVIECVAMPEGIAALLSFNPYSDANTNHARMTAATGRVLWGEVTRAVRSGNIGGVAYEAGQAIALYRGDLVSANPSPEDAAADLIRRMEPEDGSVLTIYYGAEATAESADALAQSVESGIAAVEVEIVEGGQPLYTYIVAVE